MADQKRNPFGYAKPPQGTRCSHCMAVDREWVGVSDPPADTPTPPGTGYHLIGYRHQCGHETRFDKPQLT